MAFKDIYTMFFLEIFYWDGYRYDASFSLILALNILVVVAILLGAIILLKIIACGMKSRCRQRAKQQPVQQKSYLPVQHQGRQNHSSVQKETKTCCKSLYLGIAKLFDIMVILGLILGVLLISIIPAAYYGFHLLSTAPTFIILISFNLFCIFLATWIQSYRRRHRHGHRSCGGRFKSVIKRHKFAYFLMFAGAIFVTVFFPLFLRDSCLCFYNKDYGILISSTDSVVLSTRFTRGISLDKACPEGAPCHVYATLPSTADTAVFINAHTHYDVDEITINYDLESYYSANTATRYSAYSSVYKLDIEDKGKRAVHSVLLSGLTSESLYYFEIVYGGTKQYSSTYKTLPSLGSSSTISIALGGDVGASGTGADMLTGLSATDPSVIIIGGDLAYDDGLQSCWYSWDMYLNGFDSYFQKLGRVVPMITSVGNHDVGFNAYSGNSLQTDELPLFFYYLPQHFKVDSTTGSDLMEVPDLSERKTYFYHLIGNTFQLSLDSGYVATYPDQATWMNNLLTSYGSYAKFANYHVPIYPYCFEEDQNKTNDAAQRVAAQDNFVPVFQDFGFKAIFEHHVHLFKKSLPLTDGIVDNTNGIVYFGDGNWGVTPNDCITTGTVNSEIQEVGSEERHMWIIELTGSTSYSIYPIDITGSQFYPSTIGTL